MDKYYKQSGAYIIAVNHLGNGEKTYTAAKHKTFLDYCKSYKEAVELCEDDKNDK